MGNSYAFLVVPCGQCPECRSQRIDSWKFRLMEEEKQHFNCSFVTLTYSNEKIRRTENGFLTLVKKDYQDFMKRLRKNTGRKTIKYYAVGEYGSKTMRPHYHAIMYDATKDEIVKAWTLGDVHIGQVTEDSIAYTAKYMQKAGKIPMFASDDRVPEFSLMSKHLGKSYLTPQVVKYHRQGIHYITKKGGYKQSLPRYYREKIFTEEERAEHAKETQKRHEQTYKNHVKNIGNQEEYEKVRFEQIRKKQRTVLKDIENGRQKI